MKKILFSILPLVLASVIAKGECMEEKKDPCAEEKYTQGHGMDESQMAAGYNSPARLDVKGSWDFYINVSFIYWISGFPYFNEVSHQEDYPYGKATLEIPHSYTSICFDSHFDYHPGFKIGLGMNSDRDDWSIYVEYTWHRATDSHKFVINNPSSISPRNYYIGNYSAADLVTYGNLLTDFKVSRKVSYDMLDLELSRPHYIGTKFTASPFVGFEAGWIDCKENSNYSAITPALIHLRGETDSWLVGPRLGIDTSWDLGQNFRFFANGAYALIYQKFDTEYKLYDSSGGSIRFQKVSGVNSHLEAALGFGWGDYFSNNEWHIDFSAGYEFHLFTDNAINYNDLAEATSYKASALTTKDVYLHGLTITGRLDF